MISKRMMWCRRRAPCWCLCQRNGRMKSCRQPVIVFRLPAGYAAALKGLCACDLLRCLPLASHRARQCLVVSSFADIKKGKPKLPLMTHCATLLSKEYGSASCLLLLVAYLTLALSAQHQYQSLHNQLFR